MLLMYSLHFINIFFLSLEGYYVRDQMTCFIHFHQLPLRCMCNCYCIYKLLIRALEYAAKLIYFYPYYVYNFEIPCTSKIYNLSINISTYILFIYFDMNWLLYVQVIKINKLDNSTIKALVVQQQRLETYMDHKTRFFLLIHL